MRALSRRRLLAAASACLALSACAGQTTPTLQSDVQLIAGGLSTLATTLQALGVVPANVIAEVQAEIDAIQAKAAQIASALTPGVSAVQAISASIEVIAALLAPFFPAAPTVASLVQAALSLVASLLAQLGVATARRAAPAYTPDQARVILAAAAAGTLR